MYLDNVQLGLGQGKSSTFKAKVISRKEIQFNLSGKKHKIILGRFQFFRCRPVSNQHFYLTAAHN